MKFLHLRYVDPNGEKTKRGGITVAYKEETTESGKKVAAIAIARCSPEDFYCRKKGRDIAQGRWLKAFDKLEHNEHTFFVFLHKDKKTFINTIQKLVMP